MINRLKYVGLWILFTVCTTIQVLFVIIFCWLIAIVWIVTGKNIAGYSYRWINRTFNEVL